MAKKVLIVEDNELFSELINSIFQDEGYETFVAADGKQGLELFNEHNPDCVVSDILMPNINGIDLSKQILSSERPVPIALMSGYTDRSDYSEVSESQYWMGFYSKPFDINVLLTTVKRALNQNN